MLRRLSLRRSIPLLLALFGLLAVLLLTGLNMPRLERDLEATWQRHASEILALQQANLSDHLRQQRLKELQTALADLASLEGVRWASVIDRQLAPLASSRLDREPARQPWLAEMPLAAQIAHGRPQWHPLGGHRFVALYPLRAPQGLTQTPEHALLVEWNFAPMLARQTRNAWLQLGETLLLLLALGALLNQLYDRLVTRRLAALGQVADAFATGQRQRRADDRGNDEIGQLARRCNRMFEQLESDRRALQDSEQQLRSLIDAAPVGMLVVDDQGRIDAANPAAALLFARDAGQLHGVALGALLLEPDAWTRLATQANRCLEFNARRQHGSFPVEVSCTPFQRGGQPLQLLLVRDISDRKQAESRLHHLAHFDSLTGAANRAQLLARLEQGLQQHQAQALLFLDLDHFKHINDTLGHDVGDLLLRGVTERLRRHAPAEALLARLGGDEFVILLQGALSEQAEALAERLLEAFRQPFQVRQYELFSSPSIGITVQQGGQGSATQLLKQADLALYHAKGSGRNRLAHFDNRLAEEADLRHQLEDELRHALAHDEFELYYQPQVDGDGRPRSFEALLRWHSPSRGLVSPGLFMPVLEDSGLILAATRWTFRQACRQLRQWQDMGLDWGIAVNLSPLDFRQSDLAGTLLTIIAEERAPAWRLELEITESSLLDADQQIIDCLLTLKAAGLSLFLDDFGTGYASLAYLQRFPFDGVKIDRQFVAGLPEQRESTALVRGILMIAGQLGMRVIAEGVENERQAAFLRLNGCHCLQGFLFGRPQTAAACTALARPARSDASVR